MNRGRFPVRKNMGMFPVQHQQERLSVPGNVVPLPQLLRKAHRGRIRIQAVLAHIGQLCKQRLGPEVHGQLHRHGEAPIVKEIAVQIPAILCRICLHDPREVQRLQQHACLVVIGAAIFLFQQVQTVLLGNVLQGLNRLRCAAVIDIPEILGNECSVPVCLGTLGIALLQECLPFGKRLPVGCSLEAHDTVGCSLGLCGDGISCLIIIGWHGLPGVGAQGQILQMQRVSHRAANQQQAQADHRSNQQKPTPGCSLPALLPGAKGLGFQDKVTPDIPQSVQQIQPCHSSPSFCKQMQSLFRVLWSMVLICPLVSPVLAAMSSSESKYQ